MLKKKLLVGGIAIVAAIVLFTLPRVVVDNEGRDNNLESRQDAATTTEADEAAGTPHLPEISEEALVEVNQLRENYRNNENTEKSTTFADSLIDAFARNEWYDSAAFYAGQVAEASADGRSNEKALDLYYQAFTFALDEGRARTLGQQVRYYGEAVLRAHPSNLEAKSKMAMTYLTTAEPMKGIQMLREVVEEDENNELALYNLGLLSMQSGQYDKAVERFRKVVELNPYHLQAQFFLGVSYFETGKKKKARHQFEQIKTLSSDPEVLANADNYLNKL